MIGYAPVIVDFIIRQAIKYGPQTDFDKVAKDFGERVAKLIPGDSNYEHAIIKAGRSVIRATGVVVKHMDVIVKLKDAIDAGDMPKARDILVQFVLKEVGHALPKEVRSILKAAA